MVILCWNSNATIHRCLHSLAEQVEDDFEVLLVDNGSSEPIPAEISSVYPGLNIQLYRLEKNTGFAHGNNFASTKARGEYLVLLNADAFPQPEWLQNIRNAILRHPKSFFASKLIMADRPERLDGVGDVYHVSGLVWRKAHNSLVANMRDEESEVFSACAAAAVYPIKAFREVGGFDEDYVSYAEDTDLSFRLRLRGYTCFYLPGAVVFHIGSASTEHRSDLSVYLGHRNLIWTYVKDFPGAWVWLLAPLHLAVNICMIGVGISRRQGQVMLRAKWDGLRGIPAIIRKRSNIQRSRTVPGYKLMLAMDWNPVSPLIKLIRT